MKKVKRIDKLFIHQGRKLNPGELEIGDEVEELEDDILFTKKVVGKRIDESGMLSIVYSVKDIPFKESEYIRPEDDTKEEIQERKKKWYEVLIPFRKKV